MLSERSRARRYRQWFSGHTNEDEPIEVTLPKPMPGEPHVWIVAVQGVTGYSATQVTEQDFGEPVSDSDIWVKTEFIYNSQGWVTGFKVFTDVTSGYIHWTH
jgi:hypothetical protein